MHAHYKEIVSSHELLMLPVEGGSFVMGDEHKDLWDGCWPVHQVAVTVFYIGKYPVTQALWKAVMNGENPSRFQGDDLPVEQVSWDDAQLFIEKLNVMTKFGRPANHFYRLPTEAEWEFAARGGKYHAEGYKYAGSDRLKDVGWFTENSGSETKPVGLKYPNQLGIHDMSGNVWEWCEDDWHDNYQGAPEDGRAWVDTPKRGAYRVLRGGSWAFTALYCRAAFRHHLSPAGRVNDLGFRLALSLQ
ncbi:MAG: formylglycine-generating enzyme family protein [Lewinellaceae bacterium]|nr:formylglycine-generating enzyme family protein [Lewinellaceae bacterium]